MFPLYGLQSEKESRDRMYVMMRVQVAEQYARIANARYLEVKLTLDVSYQL
jgi:hypothetical protein